MSVREELLSFLRDAEVDLPADAPEDTSLLRSGRVDSVNRACVLVRAAPGALPDDLANWDLRPLWAA